MRTIRPTILPPIMAALFLAAGAAALSGCVAYDPYYPAYGEPVVVPPPTVYAVPPPVIVQPGYRYRSWDGDHGHRDRGWRDRGWRDRGWGDHGGQRRGWDHNGDPHAWERPGGPHGWGR